MPEGLFSNEEKRKRLRKLLTIRAVVTLAVLFLASTVSLTGSALQGLILPLVTGAFFVALPPQWYIATSRISFGTQILIQFGLDLLLIGALVVATGGIQSPFAFLFGLVVVVAGTQAHAMVVMITSVLAAGCYLGAIHIFASWQHYSLSPSTLYILLQVSAFFLVGGVMAAIAQRHASLQQESSRVVRQHRRLQELHDQVMGTMQEGVLVLDRELYLQDANSAARNLLGIDQYAAGHKLVDVVNVPEMLRHFLIDSEQGMFQCEWEGLQRNCFVTATHLPEGDPNAYWLLTLIDISELRQLERKLADQNKLAAMGRMAAMLAHEVRNPMQSIGQAVELLGQTDKNRAQRIQRIISEEISRLNRLVSDMLDYVQPLKPANQQSYPCEIIDASIEQVDMESTYEIQQDCAADNIILDPDHFRLVVDNLVRNALKASPEKGSVSVLFKADEDGWLLSVCDHGSGIDETVKEQLFEPFTTAQSGGTGLGLATVWQVCQVNGWQISADSSPEGACFHVKGELLQGTEIEEDG